MRDVSMPRHGDENAERAANLLGALALSVVDRMDAAIEAPAGSLTRSAALVLLDDVPGCSIEWLARSLDLSHSATVRLVDRLVTAGLARRDPGPDRRTTALRLTADGRLAMTRVRERRAAVLRGIVDRLTSRQRAALVRTAETLLHDGLTDPDLAWRTCRLCDTARCIDPCCPVLDAVGLLLDEDGS